MEENFLHYTWKYKLFSQQILFTTNGEKIELIKPGEHNHQSGPDFFNARLKIGGTDWTGNLEIHINSSDWNLHKHQFDKAYDNVILHVVYEHDEEVKNSLHKTIPTLELKGLIPLENFKKYEQLRRNEKGVPCGKQVATPPAPLLHVWFERLVTERLEEKTTVLEEILEETKSDWEETFYRALAKNFGFKTNALPFYLLAKSLPLKVLLKHADDGVQTEALLFGQAGFLQEHLSEKYAQKLQNEYEFLKNKYSLRPIQKTIWKTGRMRPANLPAIRIAQFAALVKNLNGLFSKVKEIENVNELSEIFNSEPAPFWKDHYSFVTNSLPRSKKLGHEAIENIAINTIVPLVFLYGKKTDNEKYFARAQEILEQLQTENNVIVREFNLLGLNSVTALESQAMIQLKNNYCSKKACLNCRIGYHILST
ncbi:MAG: DUF2851 family protein [Bacteroidia bacterium]|nr:DUF2851 family protein [Bacteroidia bacterium]